MSIIIGRSANVQLNRGATLTVTSEYRALNYYCYTISASQYCTIDWIDSTNTPRTLTGTNIPYAYSICALEDSVQVTGPSPLCTTIITGGTTLCTSGGPCDGKIYFVSDEEGNDSYTATQAQNPATPWKSLAKVQSSMSIFKAGDYILFQAGDVFSGSLTITKSGVAGYPITFGAYGNLARGKPQFIGTGNTLTRLFYLFNRSYVNFDNLRITDPTLDPNTRTELAKIQRAFVFDGPLGGNCKITNCDIELVGIGAYWTNNSNSMENCDVGNLRMVVSNPINPDDDYGANPVVISSAYNNVLSNYFHDCWAVSSDYGYDGGAVELYGSSNIGPVSGNFIAYNTFYDCNGGVEIGAANSSSIIDNNIFAYNKFINNGGGVLIQNSGLYTAQITNVKLYNNVFVESKPSPRGMPSAMFRFRASSSVPNIIVFKNNVVQLYGTIDVGRLNTNGTQQLQGPQFVHENNVYKLNTSGSGAVLNFTAGASEFVISSALWANTSSLDPINWNYSPLSSSVLIDNGQNLGLTRDFAGNTVATIPEIGVLEYR